MTSEKIPYQRAWLQQQLHLLGGLDRAHRQQYLQQLRVHTVHPNNCSQPKSIRDGPSQLLIHVLW